MTNIDPEISRYFSELAKKRKKPFTPFKDRAYAKAMGKKSAEQRRLKSENPEAKNQNPPKTG